MTGSDYSPTDTTKSGNTSKSPLQPQTQDSGSSQGAPARPQPAPPPPEIRGEAETPVAVHCLSHFRAGVGSLQRAPATTGIWTRASSLPFPQRAGGERGRDKVQGTQGSPREPRQGLSPEGRLLLLSQLQGTSAQGPLARRLHGQPFPCPPKSVL